MTEILHLTHGDVIKIGNRRARVGTITGYASEYKETLERKVEQLVRADRLGHRKVWINLEATMLVGAGQPQPDRSFKTECHVGQIVFIDAESEQELGLYKITSEPNGNFGLKATTT